MPQGKKTEGEKEDITEQPPVLQVVFVIQKRPCTTFGVTTPVIVFMSSIISRRISILLSSRVTTSRGFSLDVVLTAYTAKTSFPLSVCALLQSY